MIQPFRVPIAIIAHPKRNAEAMALARQVQAEVMCWDTSEAGAEANHLAAWRWMSQEDSEWCVILEDDVIPCKSFFWQLRYALTHAPTDVVSLYLGRGRPPHWQESIARAISSDVSFLTAPALLSCQGYAIRTRLLGRFTQVAQRVRFQRLPIDEAITVWLKEEGGLKVSYPVPSLIDHRDGPTLVEHWDGPRNGLTALLTDDSDPSGALLPEIRKAWRFGEHPHWDSSSLALDRPLTSGRKKETHGGKARGNDPD